MLTKGILKSSKNKLYTSSLKGCSNIQKFRNKLAQ